MSIMLITFFASGVLMVGWAIYKIGGKKDSSGVLTLGIILLLITGASLKIEIRDDSRQETMRLLINEPVISEAQLYGYEITFKSATEISSNRPPQNIINIKSNIIPDYELENILVDPNFYDQLKVGQSFPDPNSS